MDAQVDLRFTVSILLLRGLLCLGKNYILKLEININFQTSKEKQKTLHKVF